MTLPLAKLASLVIKTIAKPVANGIKRSVKANPTLASMVAGPAQGNRDACTKQFTLCVKVATY